MEFLTFEGLIFVIIAWGTVISLLVWCLYKIFSTSTDLEELAKRKKEKLEKKKLKKSIA